MNNEEKAEILKSTEKLWNERNRLADLEKENAELKAQVEELKNMASKQVDAILKLYDQIEGMKNFYNCAHSSRALCPNEHKCKGCKDWKIAE